MGVSSFNPLSPSPDSAFVEARGGHTERDDGRARVGSSRDRPRRRAGEGAWGPAHQARAARGGSADLLARRLCTRGPGGRRDGWQFPDAGGGGSVAEGGVVPLQLLLPAGRLLVPMLSLLLAALRLGARDVILAFLALFLLLLLAVLVLVGLRKRRPREPGPRRGRGSRVAPQRDGGDCARSRLVKDDTENKAPVTTHGVRAGGTSAGRTASNKASLGLSLPAWQTGTPATQSRRVVHTCSGCAGPGAARGAARRAYLHGVDGDGQGGVVPVHLGLLAGVLVPRRALVSSPDPEHAQDDHEHQEADAHHDHDGRRAGDHCNGIETGAMTPNPSSGAAAPTAASTQMAGASSDPAGHEETLEKLSTGFESGSNCCPAAVAASALSGL